MPILGGCRGALRLSGCGSLDRDSNMPHQRLDVVAALAAALASQAVVAAFYEQGVGVSGRE